MYLIREGGREIELGIRTRRAIFIRNGRSGPHELTIFDRRTSASLRNGLQTLNISFRQYSQRWKFMYTPKNLNVNAILLFFFPPRLSLLATNRKKIDITKSTHTSTFAFSLDWIHSFSLSVHTIRPKSFTLA